MTSWKSYLFPQTVVITASPYNKYIRVNEEWGRMKLLVNGSPQSGAYIEQLWTQAWNYYDFWSCTPRNALVLGLGGGTVVSILSKHFPGIKQTIVDIDPVIVNLAKQYFFVDRIPNTTIVQDDANVFVTRARKKHEIYDLVIVDICFGRIIPGFVTEQIFLQKLRNILHPEGVLYINYLREKEYANQSDQLYINLQKIFSSVKSFAVARNRFFECK